ncbi:VOC family protein [Mycolicibacterium flavescens]|uniref:Glyoxalase n=1 Tax=Mycolicibacterium flavescens TaxID=1776 RepID=A0A1E3RLP9_MYCFV|nr:VOC family protein [Mycolicibacterium flavescens]MCV7281802.1 VOC family protein [Mycolicibacterium flavescens]ODQ90813.1 glyoxalase [Mycolicibacterium flavescens]
MIGELRTVVLDARDPRELGRFYAAVIGGDLDDADDTWVVLTDPQGRRIAFQHSPEHEPPQFPDPKGSQQLHFDILVEDPEAAEREVLALGATRVTGVPETDFRVFRDPAGHTFCLVFNTTG